MNKVRSVAAHLDLLDNGASVGVLVLDGIFNGDDMIPAARIDQVDESGQRGTFSAPGGSRHEHQPLAAFGEPGERRRQVERFERRNARWQQPYAGGQGAALVVNVGPETADRVAHKTEVRG